MTTGTIIKKQSLFDVIAQSYGAFALAQFITDNVQADFDLSAPLTPGNIFLFDIENNAANKKVLRQINGKQFQTYNLQYATNTGEFNTDFNFDFNT